MISTVDTLLTQSNLEQHKDDSVTNICRASDDLHELKTKIEIDKKNHLLTLDSSETEYRPGGIDQDNQIPLDLVNYGSRGHYAGEVTLIERKCENDDTDIENRNQIVAHGHGRLSFFNGRVYVGQFYKGLRSGWGVETYSNGNIYMGQFSNDKKNGYGISMSKSGEYYRGSWENDLREGWGELNLPKRDVIQGFFHHDEYINSSTEADLPDAFYTSLHEASQSIDEAFIHRTIGNQQYIKANSDKLTRLDKNINSIKDIEKLREAAKKKYKEDLHELEKASLGIQHEEESFAILEKTLHLKIAEKEEEYETLKEWPKRYEEKLKELKKVQDIYQLLQEEYTHQTKKNLLNADINH